MDDNNKIETDETAPPPKKRFFTLAKIAVMLDGAALVAVGLTFLFSMGATLSLFFVILTFLSALLIVLAALAGAVVGITALCLHPKSKLDVGCAITAIALPVLVVLILILCLSTGVIVIRFM